MNRKEFVALAKATFGKWQHNNATLRAAALAFFAILPLPSILLLTVIIYSQIYGQTQGTQLLISQIQVIAGPTIANLVNQLLGGVTNTFTSLFNSLLSIIFAVAGAIGAFAVLQDTFNVVWEVHLPKGRKLTTKIRVRLAPFIFVFASAILVIGWLEYTTLVFGSISSDLEHFIPPLAASLLFFLIQLLFSFVSATLLFAIIFKEIPDTEIEWGDVYLGAIITAVAFAILNNVFGFYLRTFPVTSVTGAAGSLIILLLWIFVIAEVLMYGAQFSKCYTETMGSHSNREEHHPHSVKLRVLSEGIEKVAKLNLNTKEKETQKLSKEDKTTTAPAAEKEESTSKEKNRETEIAGPKPDASKETGLEKEQIESRQAVEGKRPSEPSTEVTFEQKESNENSEKEYKLQVKWKTKEAYQKREEEKASENT